ncbi:MAG: hypothetical protein NTV87_11720, partial [Ignavibacteriae bacterium]|nr:hypothetical protein [Ignavibacteriota bacterium]
QYSAGELNNISAGNGGLNINRFTGNILAQSWGGTFNDASFFILNQKQFMLIDSVFWGGLNVIKLSKFSGKLLELKHFRFTNNQANDSLLTYLNSFSDNNIIIILKAIPSLTNFGLNSSVKARIKYFGSNYVDSVNLQSYSRWSFISYNSNPSPLICESYNNMPQYLPAVSEMSPQFFYDSAFVISTFVPSKKNMLLNWSQIIFPNSFSKTDIYGLNRNNQEVLLFPGLTNNNIINLDTISPYNYPGIKVYTKFWMDSLVGNQSPIFKNIRFNYLPPPEIIADNNSFVKSDSSVQEGDTIRIRVKYWNVGYTSADGIVNTWSVSSPTGPRKVKSDTLYSVLLKDSSLFSEAVVNTSGMRRQQIPSDTITVFFETRLISNQNEFYTYNNTAITRFVVTGDSAKPILDITYDGAKVLSGDYIQSKPQIILKFLDDSKIVIKDTSNIRVKLDDVYVPYFLNGVKNPIIDLRFPEKSLQATLIFTPALADGEHRFDYIAFDNSGNYADTVV